MTSLKHTPLYEAHCRLGGRMVPFAGFELPVQYSSIRDEHTAVREAAGLFDVSHMGQIALEGPGALAAADRLFTRSVTTLRPGRVRYGLLCNDAGGVVDDANVYRTGEHALFFCVNASNIDKDFAWIDGHCAPDAGVRNDSDRTGMLALQGPRSADIAAAVAGEAAREVRRFHFAQLDVAGQPALVSRTGYTGSDGFEFYLAAEHTEPVFDSLLEAGRPLGLVPAGLGARDTLRLEAALPLYGHELDDTTSPLEAGLDRFVKLERDFIGAPAIRRLRDAGPVRVLVGFELEDRGVARAGYPVCRDGATVGRVTSGAPSPTLGKSIGLAYVPPGLREPGSTFDVVIRDRPASAHVVATPFVGGTP